LQIVAIASASLDEYRVESRKMVIALVDMERSFIPPQHFIRLVQRRCNKILCKVHTFPVFRLSSLVPLLFRQLLHSGNCMIGSWTVDILLHIFTVIEKRLVHVFNFLFMSRLDRLRREDEGKNRASKKAQDVEQSLLSRVGFISLKLIASSFL
jgi:hypothetical protein